MMLKQGSGKKSFDGIYRKTLEPPIRVAVETYNLYKSQTLVFRRRLKLATAICLCVISAFALMHPFNMKAAGNTYYVDATSGLDSNVGTDDTHPWKTISKVNNSSFSPGDSILFKSDETWREQLWPGLVSGTASGTSDDPVTFGSYGTGLKPLILGSNDLSSSSDWTVYGGNIWQTTVPNLVDAGNLIFNNDQLTGVKIFAPYTLSDVNAQGEFYSDEASDTLYLYSTSNPGSYYSHIESANNTNPGGVSTHSGVRIRSQSYITIQNLEFRYQANMGIYIDGGPSAVTGVTVENCVFSFIGGIFYGGTRMGNGIHAWRSVNDLTVRGNNLDNIFDSGLCIQGLEAGDSASNQLWYDNTVTHSIYGFESGSHTGGTLDTIVVENNRFLDNDGGWGYAQRSSEDQLASGAIFWSNGGTATDCSFQNNYINTATKALVWAYNTSTSLTGWLLDYNTYYPDSSTAFHFGPSNTYTLADWKTVSGQDVHSAIGVETYTITYSGNTNTGGTVPVDNNDYEAGDTVTVLDNSGSLVKTGYTFSGWNTAADGGGTDRAPTSTFSMPGSNTTLYAKWAINTYTLTYTAGTHGTRTGSSPQTVNQGGDGTEVTAVPNTGYHFIEWSDNHSAVASRTDLNVQEDITATASFAINTYTLTYNSGAHGSITGSSPQTVDYDTSGTQVSAVPDTGYHFTSWSDSSTQNPRTDTSVHANVTVTASFAINTYTVTFNSQGGTAVDPITGVPYDTTVTLPDAPSKAHYTFASWNTVVGGSGNTFTGSTHVIGSITVYAQWTADTYTLTYSAGAHGSISGSSPQSVSYGTSGTAVTAVAANGYDFASWSDNSTQNPRTDADVQGNIIVTATFIAHVYDIYAGNLTHTENGATFVFNSLPAGETGIDITITSSTTNTHTLPDGKTFIKLFDISAIDQDGNPVTTGIDVHLTLDYPAATDADEAKYTIMYWDGSAWSTSGISDISVDTANNQISFDTTHFTDFAIMGQASVINNQTILPVTGENIVILIGLAMALTLGVLVGVRVYKLADK